MQLKHLLKPCCSLYNCLCGQTETCLCLCGQRGHVCLLLTKGLPRGHGCLSHTRQALWEAGWGNAWFAGHHFLILEPFPPLLFQLLLDFVDLFGQEVVVLRLEGTQQEGGRMLHNTSTANNKYTSSRAFFLSSVCTFLTLLLADSYMSPSTFRA